VSGIVPVAIGGALIGATLMELGAGQAGNLSLQHVLEAPGPTESQAQGRGRGHAGAGFVGTALVPWPSLLPVLT